MTEISHKIIFFSKTIRDRRFCRNTFLIRVSRSTYKKIFKIFHQYLINFLKHNLTWLNTKWLDTKKQFKLKSIGKLKNSNYLLIILNCFTLIYFEFLFLLQEICIEIKSSSNTQEEMKFKKELYFKAGAEEFWLCNESGEMSFFNSDGQITNSAIVPNFPASIEL